MAQNQESPFIKLLGSAGIGVLVAGLYFVFDAHATANDAADDAKTAKDQIAVIQRDVAEIKSNDAVQTNELQHINTQLAEIKRLIEQR